MKWQKRTISQDEPEVLEASGEMKSSHSPIPANSGTKLKFTKIFIIITVIMHVWVYIACAPMSLTTACHT